MSGLEDGAILSGAEVVALHVRLAKGMPASVSTQIGWLRQMLAGGGNTGWHWDAVRSGDLTLVVHVDSADIMASLIFMKSDYEDLKMTFAGALEAHLLAEEIAKADVSVVLSPSKPFPGSWDQRRMYVSPHCEAFAIQK